MLYPNAMLKFGQILPAFILLAACEGVAPEALRQRSVEKTLIVQHPVKWKLGFWDVMLAAGTYVSKFEDNSGTYYLGRSPCVYTTGKVRNEPPAGTAADCGIFVPNKPGRAAKVLIVNGTNRDHTAFNADGTPDTSRINQVNEAVPIPNAALLTALIAAEKGRFRHFNSQPSDGWFEIAVRAKP
jgi:hypothetical protein